MINEVDKLLSLMDGGEITDIYDDGLKHLNEDGSIRETMVSAIAEDIDQYLDKSWGDEKPEVRIIDDEVFMVYEGKKMKPIMFYACASNNMGKVPKEMFETYAKEYEDL